MFKLCPRVAFRSPCPNEVQSNNDARVAFLLDIDTYPLPSRDQLRRSRVVSFAKKYSESRMGLRPSLDIVLSPHRTQLF